jgi:DNA repair exonuclease SbcCD ATPase subunit
MTMPKPIATYEAVAQTAEALLNESQDPTLIAIQERTGGSFSTIKRHLDVWTAKRQSAQAVQVPASLAEQGAALVRDIWRAAEVQANQAVNAIKLESERLVAVAEQHTAEALAAIERLEHTNEAQASTIATLQAELERHRAAAQTALATATAQAHTAEQRVAQLTNELAQTRSELTTQAKIVGEAEALRKQVVDLQGMIERMGQRGTKARST